MRWILDDGPLGHLIQIEPTLVDRWTSGLLLTSESSVEAMRKKATPRVQDLSRRLLEPQPGPLPALIECFSVLADTEAFECFTELHGNGFSDADKAEHECIAWALTHPDSETAFVCIDKKAVLIAMAELGCGRVADPFDVWLDLLGRNLVTSQEFASLCRNTWVHRRDGLRRVPGRIRRRLMQLGLPSMDWDARVR